MQMKPRITILTLAVDDLEKSLNFYRDGLGFRTDGIIGTEFEHGAVVFIDLENGMKLALFSREDLAHDATIEKTPPSPTELSIGHVVGSREEVDVVMEEARNAGAKVVKVFDRSCNDPRRCYVISEIEKKAEAAGAEVSQVRSNKFAKIKLKSGKVLKEWEIYKDYLEADKIINIPIAKSHSLSRVTLGAKNLMGVIGGDRGLIHNGFDEKLADICGSILPTLTIIDAYRILLTNGPTGGNPADVKLQKSLIASKCMVTADYLGLDFFSLHINQVGHLREMVDRGLNQFDLNKLNVKKIVLDS